MKNSKDLVLVALFTALITIGAFLKIPIPPAPITLQTLFVFMAGVLLGKRKATISVIVYITLGLIGLPIFTEGGGPGYIFKPSFGFLLAFILAAYLIGYYIENRKVNFKNVFIASTLGLLVIYTIGLPYLYYILNSVIGLEKSTWYVFKVGMFLYLPGDLLKIILTAVLVPRVHHRLKDF
ncbi:MAG: biotin transporter BioY [Halanaerobiales bacterium]